MLGERAGLVAGEMSWERVIAYNAMEFALQLPMGVGCIGG